MVVEEMNKQERNVFTLLINVNTVYRYRFFVHGYVFVVIFKRTFFFRNMTLPVISMAHKKGRWVE